MAKSGKKLQRGRMRAAEAKAKLRRKAKRAGNLAEFFAASPLRGSGLVIERTVDAPREIDL